MKIAVTTSGNSLDAPFEPRFGRAPGFLVYDLDKESFLIVNNQANAQAAQGAGIQAAQTLHKQGAEVLITGHCGPKAFQVLAAAKIRVYNTQAATVNEALEQFNSGALEEASDADVQGHW